MVCHDVILTDLNNMADYHEWLNTDWPDLKFIVDCSITNSSYSTVSKYLTLVSFLHYNILYFCKKFWEL